MTLQISCAPPLPPPPREHGSCTVSAALSFPNIMELESQQGAFPGWLLSLGPKHLWFFMWPESEAR